MIELIVALTFALIFVTAVMHTIAAFGYSALYSKKNDMKFRKLAEYKLRQINILPSLEDNRKFHVTKYSDDTPPGFFVEKIPTCIFKFSPVDYLDLKKRYDKKGNESGINASLWFIGNTGNNGKGTNDFWTEFSAQLTDKHKRVFIKPIFSEKCKFPLTIKINVPSIIKDSTIEIGSLMLDRVKQLRNNDIKEVKNWNELSDKKILFNYQNLLIFQLLGDKLKKLYVFFE
jgi:hypothetical protein